MWCQRRSSLRYSGFLLGEGLDLAEVRLGRARAEREQGDHEQGDAHSGDEEGEGGAQRDHRVAHARCAGAGAKPAFGISREGRQD